MYKTVVDFTSAVEQSSMGLARRVFAESAFRPHQYDHGFVEDVARTIHVGKLDGIGQEKKRVEKLITESIAVYQGMANSSGSDWQHDENVSVVRALTTLRDNLRDGVL